MEKKIKKITKSTPEQKEGWKDRLIEEAFIYQGREAGVIETITFDYDKLLSFISQELDKAREEGKKEESKKLYRSVSKELYKLYSDIGYLGDLRDEVHDLSDKYGQLSKLNK